MSELINTQDGLEGIVATALQHRHVAVDTELVWERTYYPHLGIVQIAFPGDQCHLIDATAVDLRGMGELLTGDVSLILHDAIQDLAILRRAAGASPRTIFDTRVAAGFAGLSSTISLRDLLAEIVGVELAKTETRTDWLRRPLASTQIGYALDDVRYLHAAQAGLEKRAEERGVGAWLRAELAALDEPALYEERDPRQQFERIKGRGRLSRRELAVLRELTAWREREARACDRPRARVVSDRMLLLLAQRKPRTHDDLSELRQFKDGQLRRFGEAMVDAVRVGLETPHDQCPPGLPRTRFDATFDERAKAAIELLESRSADRGVDHALVATRSQIRALVRDGAAATEQCHRVLRGWRRELVGEDLLEQVGR